MLSPCGLQVKKNHSNPEPAQSSPPPISHSQPKLQQTIRRDDLHRQRSQSLAIAHMFPPPPDEEIVFLLRNIWSWVPLERIGVDDRVEECIGKGIENECAGWDRVVVDG